MHIFKQPNNDSLITVNSYKQYNTLIVFRRHLLREMLQVIGRQVKNMNFQFCLIHRLLIVILKLFKVLSKTAFSTTPVPVFQLHLHSGQIGGVSAVLNVQLFTIASLPDEGSSDTHGISAPFPNIPGNKQYHVCFQGQKTYKNTFIFPNQVYVTCVEFYHQNFNSRTKGIMHLYASIIKLVSMFISFTQKLTFTVYSSLCFTHQVDSIINELLLFRKKKCEYLSI